MARKKAHEEHTNHEAWAIPYGDLVTLLLALFVVLYSMSAINEGKFRVLSDSLNAAFNGKPRTSKPIEIGDRPQKGKGPAERSTVIPRQGGSPPQPTQPATNLAALRSSALRGMGNLKGDGQAEGQGEGQRDGSANLKRMADAVNKALGPLIERRMVTVRRNAFWLEIDIRTDILFPSGVAEIAPDARPVLAQLAAILKPFPNPVRIEGHTDNVPIRTVAFPSNWQLSASRAAGVVSLFMQEGVEPTRMSVAGFGEYQPAADNRTVDGRNRNRRVLVVVLGVDDQQLARQLADGGAAEDGQSLPQPEPTALIAPEQAAEPLPDGAGDGAALTLAGHPAASP